MTDEELRHHAGTYLRELCERIPSRSVGSEGNREATRFFAERMRSFGFEVECPEFDCMDWTQQGASLTVSGEPVEALVSPYSLGGRFDAALAVAQALGDKQGIRRYGYSYVPLDEALSRVVVDLSGRPGLDFRIDFVRARIGTVLQGGRLWAGDILTNIVGATSLTVDEAWEAARAAAPGGRVVACARGFRASASRPPDDSGIGCIHRA